LLWKSKRQAQSPPGPPDKAITLQITRLQGVLDLVPATLISKRSVDCKQYARALHHLEHYVEHPPPGLSPDEKDALFEDLLDIYANIDDPDGVEGINAHRMLDLSHQILGHKKAGRWTEAQTWYEVQLAAEPNNASVQLELLTCLKESGQHGEFYPFATSVHKSG
jgi:serine/threonine-protein kinase ATR